jgi:chromate transport protein ChrA
MSSPHVKTKETDLSTFAKLENGKSSLDIKWVIISLAVSLVLAKFSKQSMCTYMYLSLAWLYITILVSQSWRKFERDNIQIASTTIASLIGWLIGTLVVWKTRHHHNAFFE